MLLSSISPTPVQRVDRLGAALGLAAGRLWVKRDDLTGLAGGGNKVRKLEHLCMDALAQGCDTLVTGGGRQSNHARLTAAAAAVLGLRCRLVLGSDPPETATGNVVLDHLLGAEIVWAGTLDYYALEAAIDAEAERVAGAGGRPYAMPLGGASTVGQQGYVAAALELRDQLPDTALIVVADGTGGTHAGFVAGWGAHDAVLGIDVGTRPDLDDSVPRHALEAAAFAGRPAPTGTCRIDHAHFAPGYGEPNPGAREALDLAARLEGLILDPVYSGKAMAGLVTAAREDHLPPEGTIVFVHTGGMPALFSTLRDLDRAKPVTEIRVATVDDLDALVRLRTSSTEERRDVGPDPSFPSRFREWFDQESHQRTFWLAVDGDEPIGMTNLLAFERMPSPDIDAGRWGYLGNMYVRPEHRDRGVGRRLLDALIAHADRLGLERIVLSPSERSIPFYRRAGFDDADQLLLRPRL